MITKVKARAVVCTSRRINQKLTVTDNVGNTGTTTSYVNYTATGACRPAT